MQYRPLGTSSFNVSILGFGGWQIGDSSYWGDDRPVEPDRVVGAALDAGINLFDTAEVYGDGQSEIALGKALGTRREEVYLVSKVPPHNCAPDVLRASCEDSLRRLGTDRIDLYLVHWPCRDVAFEESAAVLDALLAEGKIRAVGVSNFGPEDLSDWTASGKCVANQIGYNLLFRAAEYDMLPACVSHDVGTLIYMPLMQGILTGRWTDVEAIPKMRRRTRHFHKDRFGVTHGGDGCEDLLFDTLQGIRTVADDVGMPMTTLALAWVLHQPGVSSALMGTRYPDQLSQNIAAADVVLDDDTLARLDVATAPLKEVLGPNPDMWRTGEEARIR
jgi:aryl-alcohol dehydrogenase-like predicted oxidoreductase